MTLWIIVGLVSIILLYFVFVKPLEYWKNHNVPQYHFLITIREILLGFIPYRSITEGVQKVYDDFPHSRYVGIYQFTKPVLAVRDPELIKQISVKDFDHFVDHLQFLPEDSEPVWEKNLFALKGDKWREMRSTLSPSFTSSKMKVMFGLISDYAKQFVTYFEEQNCETISVEMRDICTRFTNDVIATSAFGISCDSMRNPNNEFYTMGNAVTNLNGILSNLKLMVIIMLPKIAKMLEIKLFTKLATSFFTKLVKENIESREKSGIVRQDMIHLLMEARKGRSKYDKTVDRSLETDFTLIQGSADQKNEKQQEVRLTDDDIAAQAFIFFFGGFDSVATLTCFMAHELAVNVDVQERLQNEIEETLQECDGNLTYEALTKMKYMDMVIAETLRKWPAAPATDRICTKPYTIQPEEEGEVAINLREGDLLWFLVFGIHRDPKIFFEPERFDPERFNDDNKSKIPPYCYMPFGVGPRSCIGNRFALMETKLLFFYILSKFDLTVTKKTVVPLQVAKSQFQLTAKDGFWLGLKCRH